MRGCAGRPCQGTGKVQDDCFHSCRTGSLVVAWNSTLTVWFSESVIVTMSTGWFSTTSVSRATTMSVYHAENIGTHYARTIHLWRERFHIHLDRVRALGFDDRFIRMWDLYLAYCEAAFLERHAGDFQLLLTKNYNAATLFNEPWADRDTAPLAAASASAA